MELDVNVTSLHRQTAGPLLDQIVEGEETYTPMQKVEAGIQRVLEAAEEIKRKKYQRICTSPFFPVVFSAGGALAPDTKLLFDHWYEVLGGYEFSQLQLHLSIGLLRNRARCFML